LPGDFFIGAAERMQQLLLTSTLFQQWFRLQLIAKSKRVRRYFGERKAGVKH
jgi:hypothetical protein